VNPLQVKEVARSFGGVVAVDGVSFDLEEGELLGLIGPNGAGKSTVLAMLAGSVSADNGSILLNGQEVAGRSSHAIARLGLRRCYQIPHTIEKLSVLENMLVGGGRAHCTLRSAVLKPWSTRAADRKIVAEAMVFLRRFGVEHLAQRPAGELSGGQRKLLSIGQALMGRPNVLVLDEPVAGVHPRFVDDIAALLLDVRKQGVSLLIVEHNLRFLEMVADRVVVMARGQVLAQGTLAAVRERDDVADAYLGRRTMGGDHSEAETNRIQIHRQEQPK
jgi:ABC-type branched-subunit amino acid transport system ATPase component